MRPPHHHRRSTPLTTMRRPITAASSSRRRSPHRQTPLHRRSSSAPPPTTIAAPSTDARPPSAPLATAPADEPNPTPPSTTTTIHTHTHTTVATLPNTTLSSETLTHTPLIPHSLTLGITLSIETLPLPHPIAEQNPKPTLPTSNLSFLVPSTTETTTTVPQPSNLYMDRNAIRLGKRPIDDDTSNAHSLEGITLSSPIEVYLDAPPGFDPIRVEPQTRDFLAQNLAVPVVDLTKEPCLPDFPTHGRYTAGLSIPRPTFPASQTWQNLGHRSPVLQPIPRPQHRPSSSNFPPYFRNLGFAPHFTSPTPTEPMRYTRRVRPQQTIRLSDLPNPISPIPYHPSHSRSQPLPVEPHFDIIPPPGLNHPQSVNVLTYVQDMNRSFVEANGDVIRLLHHVLATVNRNHEA